MESKPININLYNDRCSRTDKKPEPKSFFPIATIKSNVYLLNYFFKDRYNILFSRILNTVTARNLSFNDQRNLIFNNNNESYTFSFKFFAFENNIALEKSIDLYTKFLRKCIVDKYPPYMGLIYKYNLYYLVEFKAMCLNNQILSYSNSLDLSFQILYMLMCIYNSGYIIENFTISLVELDNAVDLEFDISNIKFKLTNVKILPIFNFNSKIVFKEENDETKKCVSYNNIILQYFNIKFELGVFPIIDSTSELNPAIFILSFLLQHFKNLTNICSFEYNAKNITNISCFKSNSFIGQVYFDNTSLDDTISLNVCVGQTPNNYIFLNIFDNEIFESQLINFKQVYPSKFIKENKLTTPTFTYEF